MPGGDRTGPNGAGPMTGRAAGFCAGYPMQGYVNPIGGRGFGQGRGGGRRWQMANYNVPFTPAAPAMTAEQELAELKQQAEYLKNTVNDVNKRIEQLEK